MQSTRNSAVAANGGATKRSRDSAHGCRTTYRTRLRFMPLDVDVAQTIIVWIRELIHPRLP